MALLLHPLVRGNITIYVFEHNAQCLSDLLKSVIWKWVYTVLISPYYVWSSICDVLPILSSIYIHELGFPIFSDPVVFMHIPYTTLLLNVSVIVLFISSVFSSLLCSFLVFLACLDAHICFSLQQFLLHVPWYHVINLNSVLIMSKILSDNKLTQPHVMVNIRKI